MYNFLDSKLFPRVTTKTECLEGFEVENLIHSNFVQRGRGFIAYTTAKPPVDVDFELLCNVSLSHIVVNARNGNQKSCGFEILAKTPTTEYVTVSKVSFDEDGVVICNARKYSRSKRPKETDQKYHLAFFKSNEFRTFLNASNVRIRILKTNFKTPCLGAVEIWGWVSRTCSKVTTDTINRLLNKVDSDNSGNDNDPSGLSDDFKIPEEFLDEITYEVMSLPMTLPSGHTVDQTTLEKCCATDASCGRHPSDPFTGLRFCEGRNPVLNSSLKSRIDMFLLKNAHRKETFSIKRTVGRANLYKRDGERVTHSSPQANKKIRFDNDRPRPNLEDAVNDVLNSKDFIRFSSDDTEEESESDKCYKCQARYHLYILSCTHIYCRECLISNNDFCDICNRKIPCSGITRHHSQY